MDQTAVSANAFFDGARFRDRLSSRRSACAVVHGTDAVVKIDAPPGCAYSLREVRRDEYDLFCIGYSGADYPIARLVR